MEGGRAGRTDGLTWHADLLMTSRCFLDGILHRARVAALASGMPQAASGPARLSLPQQVLGACAFTGAFAHAEALHALVERTLDEAGQPAFGPEPHHCGRLLLRRGDWEQSEALLTAAVDWARRAGDRSREAFAVQVLGELYLDRGEAVAAEETLRAAAHLQRDGAFVLGAVDALALLARCLAVAGRPAEAEAAWAEAQGILTSSQDWGRLAAAVALAEGMVRSRQDRWAEADAAFARALDILRAEGLRWDEAFTLDCWGRGLRKAGGTLGAELQRQAQNLWTALGAGRYAERRARSSGTR